jgi:hypothetical protein
MNIEIANVVEICPQLIIAVLTIAYPIIVEKCSNIGEKYNSKFLQILFRNEWPERRICKRCEKVSVFLLVLILSLLSLLPLMFQCEPLFGWNNCIINNSASILVLGMTILLTIVFIQWLYKVILYCGNIVRLAKYLTKLGLQDKKHDEYFLKTLNEITLYAVEQQKEHLEKTMCEFYTDYINKLKQNERKE